MQKGINSLSSTSIITQIKSCFDRIIDHRNRKCATSLSDAAMSVFAMFKLKMPSLLELETQLNEPTTMENLKKVFLLEKPASDQGLRDILDPMNCIDFAPAFREIHSTIQRSQALDKFRVLDDCYLLAADGTGMFSSKKISSKNCLTKKHGDDSVTNHMQLLAGAIVHPQLKIVLPLFPEPVQNGDGATKNDCETNAFLRFKNHAKSDFPKRKFIYLLDSLYAKSPTLKSILAGGDRFIANCKEGDHKTLFTENIPALENDPEFQFHETQVSGKKIRFRFINGIDIFKNKDSINCSFFEYQEQKKDGSWTRFTWLTDIEINLENILEIVSYGRSRWKIENETFNTLKSHGYNFEHNYGLGNKNLRANFAILMMLAFLSDQANELGDSVYQEAVVNCRIKRNFWERIRSVFKEFIVNSFDQIIAFIANKNTDARPRLDAIFFMK